MSLNVPQRKGFSGSHAPAWEPIWDAPVYFSGSHAPAWEPIWDAPVYFLVPTRRRGNRFGTRRCIFWFPRAGVGTDLGRAGVRFGGLAARDAGMSRMRSHAGAWEREIFLIDCRVTLFHYVQ